MFSQAPLEMLTKITSFLWRRELSNAEPGLPGNSSRTLVNVGGANLNRAQTKMVSWSGRSSFCWSSRSPAGLPPRTSNCQWTYGCGGGGIGGCEAQMKYFSGS